MGDTRSSRNNRPERAEAWELDMRLRLNGGVRQWRAEAPVGVVVMNGAVAVSDESSFSTRGAPSPSESVEMVGLAAVLDEPNVYDYIAEVSAEGPDGRPAVTRLTIIAKPGGPAIGARQLQDSRIGQVCRAAIDARTWPIDPITREPLPRSFHEMAKTEIDKLRRRPRAPRGGVPAAEVEKTAELYREAQATGAPTTRYVQERLRVSSSTARKRVMQARKAGLLPPAGSTRPRL